MKNFKINKLFEVLVVLTADLLVMLLIFKSAVLIRTDLLPLLYGNFPAEFSHGKIINNWWVFVIWIFFYAYEGLYTSIFSFWDEVRSIWKAILYTVVCIFVIVSLGKLGADVSRTVMLVMGALAMIIMPFTKILLKKLLQRFGLLRRRAVILGAGEAGRLIVQALRREPNFGYNILGFIDDDPDSAGKILDGLKVHGGLEQAERYIDLCSIQDVFIAIPEKNWDKTKDIINHLQHKAERVLFVPGISGIAMLGTKLLHFFHEQTFVIEVNNNVSGPMSIFMKRCFDLFLCILSLPFLLLVVGVLALIIKIDSKGPIFFSHKRVGQRGKPFSCLKFRSMHSDAEKKLQDLLKSDPKIKEEWERYYKLKDDPRISRVGKILRKTSLDELPQIFNVIAGQMSIVGPRPVTQDEIDNYYKDQAEFCFSAPPGITGLWQVSGRSDVDYDERISLDSWYIRNWNPWIDIVIIFETFKAVLQKKGAR